MEENVMTDHPLCTRHGQPQIAKKNGGYTGRCPECMRQDNRHKSMTRKGKPNPLDLTNDFAPYPELLEFVTERAHANVRSIGQEILYRVQAGYKAMQGSYKAKAISEIKSYAQGQKIQPQPAS